MQNAVGRFSERGIVGRSFAIPNFISAGEEDSPAAQSKREDLFMQDAVGRFSEQGIVGRSSATPDLISAGEEGSPAALNSEKSGGRFSAPLAKQMVREDLTTMGRGI